MDKVLSCEDKDTGSNPVREITGSNSAWVEYSVWIRDVAGSNPAFLTRLFLISSVIINAG